MEFKIKYLSFQVIILHQFQNAVLYGTKITQFFAAISI